jgi:hypothetical protein
MVSATFLASWLGPSCSGRSRPARQRAIPLAHVAVRALHLLGMGQHHRLGLLIGRTGDFRCQPFKTQLRVAGSHLQSLSFDTLSFYLIFFRHALPRPNQAGLVAGEKDQLSDHLRMEPTE